MPRVHSSRNRPLLFAHTAAALDRPARPRANPQRRRTKGGSALRSVSLRDPLRVREGTRRAAVDRREHLASPEAAMHRRRGRHVDRAASTKSGALTATRLPMWMHKQPSGSAPQSAVMPIARQPDRRRVTSPAAALLQSARRSQDSGRQASVLGPSDQVLEVPVSLDRRRVVSRRLSVISAPPCHRMRGH